MVDQLSSFAAEVTPHDKPAKWEPKVSSAVRPRCWAWPVRGRT